VKDARFAGVWIRRGTDFSPYRRLIVMPAEIALRTASGRGSDRSFPLDERRMADLRELLRESFRAELVDRGGWLIAQEPGPDVLLLQGGLIDLVVRVPPERPGASARGGTWVASYGEMTLVIQLYDSRTHEILARIADRQQATPASGKELSRVEFSAASDLRVFFGTWARRLRQGLDAARAAPP
jgi:hypothetical protein